MSFNSWFLFIVGAILLIMTGYAENPGMSFLYGLLGGLALRVMVDVAIIDSKRDEK